MSAARELLDEAQRHGVAIRAEDGQLKLKAPTEPPADLIERLRLHKADIIAELDNTSFDERAAIAEFDAGVRRDWAEGFACLDAEQPPADVPLRRWQQFVDDCGRFLDDGWATRAFALGWGPLDLFGCDRYAPFTRIDRMGLLWLLNGRRLVVMTDATAVIEDISGTRKAYWRLATQPGRVLAWELA